MSQEKLRRPGGEETGRAGGEHTPGAGRPGHQHQSTRAGGAATEKRRNNGTKGKLEKEQDKLKEEKTKQEIRTFLQNAL